MSSTSTSSRSRLRKEAGNADDDGKPRPHRIICSLQSTGRIGKSTVAQALISWFGFAGVEFAAVDADGEHQTLSRWYPDIVTRLPFRETDDLLPILNETGSMPAMLIDYPAQSTQSLLSAFAHFQAFDFFQSKNTRLTSLIFASDERPAMASAAEIISTFGPRSDYITVKNPARFQSEIFMHSQLPNMLAEYSAPTIEIGRITTEPRLTILTLNRPRLRKLLPSEKPKSFCLPARLSSSSPGATGSSPSLKTFVIFSCRQKSVSVSKGPRA